MARRRGQRDFQAAFQEMRAGYDMAKPSRFRRVREGVSSTGRDADWHIRSQAHYFLCMELSRELERNEPLLRQAVRRLVNNVNPGAMTPDPDTGNDAVDRRLRERWHDWSTNPQKCHAAGKLNWRRMTNVAFARIQFDGDAFGIPITKRSSPRYGTLQTHEGHRCRTPNFSRVDRGVCGVETDSYGGPTKFWFTKKPESLHASLRVDAHQPIAAKDSDGHPQVLHVYNPERFVQSRGITAMTPVYDIVGMRGDLEFANLVKAQVASTVTYVEEIDPTLWQFFQQQAVSAGTEFDVSDYFGDPTDTVNLNPGAIHKPRPGTKLVPFSPSIPNETYFQFVKQLISYLAVNLDLPYCVLMLDASDTNFSSYRNTIEQARLTFRETNDWLEMQWHRPAWAWRCRTEAETDDVIGPFLASEGLDVLCRHKWNPLGHEYIEPVKDATADTMQRAKGLTSPRRLTAKRHGCDWKVLFTEIVDDHFDAIQYAHQKAQSLGVEGVTWRDLLPMPNLDGVRIQINDENEPDTPKQPAKESTDEAA